MNIWAGLILPMTISMTGSSEHGTDLLVTENNIMNGKSLCPCGKQKIFSSGSHDECRVLTSKISFGSHLYERDKQVMHAMQSFLLMTSSRWQHPSCRDAHGILAHSVEYFLLPVQWIQENTDHSAQFDTEFLAQLQVYKI